jgi:hypothetical protein
MGLLWTQERYALLILPRVYQTHTVHLIGRRQHLDASTQRSLEKARNLVALVRSTRLLWDFAHTMQQCPDKCCHFPKEMGKDPCRRSALPFHAARNDCFDGVGPITPSFASL